MKKHIVLNGNEFHSIDELHEILKTELELPDYYGKNLDALWDCLTGFVAFPLAIEWRDYQASKDALGDYAEQVLDLFKDLEKEADFEIIVE